ncbi:DMT family transporter [Seleniivibrio woodruffii]|uniref:Guanidinium exporter n=1 Tax=Seleniivibrio woodruffii TaxID=1078050 RepID=A0A4R1K9W5_9BACT|nr:SMR family transporter [Seleniivibrio woodruffii]TCK59969.1 paired small multidrug resistance pump [Seleniivibrio woodruffii]TVZ35810.1 paired small multidrug resistance pump [Seleniivibrio woodruffii]
MEWIYLILAGIFEITGVASISILNRKQNAASFLAMVATFGLSFLFLSMAMKTIPMSTAYAVWTGIGASGGAAAGIFLYNEPKSFIRVASIIIVLASAVGLKLIN